MLKKLLIMAFFLLILAFPSFAKEYIVNSVNGRVQYESEAGVWKNVYEGQKLDSLVNINVGMNSFVIFLDGDKTFTVNSMKKGSIASLIPDSGEKKLKKGKVMTTKVAEKSVSSSKGVATAASRASDVKDDIEWDE